ncbi:uroporphyrinogen-III synthase [Thalassovita gelatinovora]|uniref:Uroporphyrinogen-III synthase n=1 Tax=Thalassovita gelatinovora TaxID=53501 RepID=A0A0P1FWP3_THAGE|nr:uroporphyrinogen-III synthase [Thalassovita gelatinovora]QIZ81019.1 uroporphyrinogen-III synthase [Thalassovita gelatinovora]CUH65051.1 uroporphyrinogen-III synthase [Thalassovita gelatinovora]SEP87353.1 uroporphyrinogen-III synthase [Thalassovita gelatinovora]
MATLLLTRPLASSQRFAAQLRERLGDLPVVISPVLRIDPISPGPDLIDAQTLIFTSQNALGAVPAGQGRRCYVVGPATAVAARAKGFEVIAEERDAETLFQRILADAPQEPLLHLRGRHARGHLADRLTAAGIATRARVVYEQLETALSEDAKTLLAGDQAVIVPLFSPRSAKLFSAQHVGNAPLLIAALSEAVVAALGELPVFQVDHALSPDSGAMIDTIEGLIDAGRALEASHAGK